jgi:chemotaxis protein methyltransferase CheR
VQIYATCISDTAIDLIRDGQYDLKKTEVSQENYRRYSGNRDDLSKYFTVERYHALRDTSLIRDVEFKKVRTCLDEMPPNIKLIIFRNNLIYYSPALHDRAVRHMHAILSVNGHLILGIQEKINVTGTFNGFEPVNEAEKVFRKKQIL